MADESYIQLTIELAKKGQGFVSPNPLVGCVITKNDRIIGAGYHQKYGENHAEINAINSSIEPVEGSTLYVNLEPCSHFGNTPPCADRIIQEKIKRVVIGTLDINPLIVGNGVKKLKQAGIDVKVGILENECIELNRFFLKFIQKKIPYVTLKAAQTLDGMIADGYNNSEWISSVESRKYVHRLRTRYDAVLIGSKTAKIDDPSLTVRLVEGRNPYRIILDPKLNLSTKLKVFEKNKDGKTIVVTIYDNRNKKHKLKKLKDLGVNTIFVKANHQGNLHLKSMLKELGKLNLTSILVEGGSRIYSSFIKQKLFDDMLLFLSPKILGNGLKVFSGLDFKKINDAYKLKLLKSEKIGEDILLELAR